MNDLKTIYAYKVKEFDYIIYTGFQHSNIDEVIKKRQNTLSKQKNEYVKTVMIFTLF